ncbi:n-alpha-acetyltransferase 60 [Anaeramoeba flamelloides]|uniref:N-alpha-acetyltransferase n=1 Tax=Anaeramoeba flamelloides TaxID=1746091 RepID=A0AAV7Z0C5_9EUKA|nr:n-alpha-acetyltransferase [Anaeramoeba flamelloides]KAJ6247750.1 n-alpha-acetyltransferase 60 [Anaeramoeba flamelloides]
MSQISETKSEQPINPKTEIVGLKSLKEEYLFRKIKRSDIETLQELQNKVFGHKFSFRFLKPLIGSKLACLVFHKKTGELVGSITARVEIERNWFSKNKVKGYISSIGLALEHSGKGIGYNLLNHIVKYFVNAHQAQEIYLHTRQTNVRAVTFYKRYGFQITSKVAGYYSSRKTDPDAYIMTFYPRCVVKLKQTSSNKLQDRINKVNPEKKPLNEKNQK